MNIVVHDKFTFPCYSAYTNTTAPSKYGRFFCPKMKEEGVLLKKIIFLTAIFLSFHIFLGIAYAEKENVKKITVTVSAYYTPVKGQKHYATGSYRGDMKMNGGKKTFTKKVPKIGMAATDPDVIPMGKQIYIPPLGIYAVAEDIGGAINGKAIDIYMGIGEEALNKALIFGRKRAEAVII